MLTRNNEYQNLEYHSQIISKLEFNHFFKSRYYSNHHCLGANYCKLQGHLVDIRYEIIDLRRRTGDVPVKVDK